MYIMTYYNKNEKHKNENIFVGARTQEVYTFYDKFRNVIRFSQIVLVGTRMAHLQYRVSDFLNLMVIQ